MAGSDGMDTGAVSQLDTAQAELEAGNASLLQGAPFLVEMLALQAAAPGMQPVSFLSAPLCTSLLCGSWLKAPCASYGVGLEVCLLATAAASGR